RRNPSPERGAPSLQWHQLRGRGSGLLASEVLGVLDGSRRLVFLQVGPVDRALQALASRPDGADGDLAVSDLDRAAWLLEERPVPASRLEAPGPHEDAAFHHHAPDADEPVRLRPCPDAQDLAAADLRHDVSRKTFRFHGRLLELQAATGS